METEFGALADLQQYIDGMPKAATEAARLSLNDIAEGPGLAIFRDAVAEEANFPPGYLNDSRLGVTKRAKNADLATTITGRFRATSLARFVANPVPGRRGGVRVEVKRGQSRVLPRAFIVRLRAGATTSNDKFNVGLAIRLKPGETLRNTKGARAVALDKGLYLLYGPSVDQIFRETGPQEAPEVLKLVEQEFYRQFFRLAGGKRRASR